jgi:hypothetical protein
MRFKNYLTEQTEELKIIKGIIKLWSKNHPDMKLKKPPSKSEIKKWIKRGIDYSNETNTKTAVVTWHPHYKNGGFNLSADSSGYETHVAWFQDGKQVSKSEFRGWKK